MDVLAIRISYTGELGWEFYMEKDGMKAVYDCMIEEGEGTMRKTAPYLTHTVLYIRFAQHVKTCAVFPR